ncbi:MAG: c-type cytochrome OmcS [Candidatus Zixiibacteriota bacterium]
MRTSWILAVVLLLITAESGIGFHNPNASQCSGCHTFGADDQPIDDDGDDVTNPYMLKAESASDVCLNCHATNHGAVFAHDVNNPAPEKGGGNFIYLLEDNLNDSPSGEGEGGWIPGDGAGHNIDAPEHGLRPDMTLTTAPGGEYPSRLMSCTSCHDPHGNDNFRLLRGTGPVKEDGFVFTYEAPEAVGINIHAGAESNSNHTAYHSGMSEWCANCHGRFHNDDYPNVKKHPTGVALGVAAAAAYNAYNGTSDLVGGYEGTAYLALVPFEDPSPSNTTSSTAGPTASSKIMCLSCHRAHASSAPDAGRWDFNVTFLDDDGRESGSHPLPNPYGPGQRSLCNKCHIKDDGNSAFAVSPD